MINIAINSLIKIYIIFYVFSLFYLIKLFFKDKISLLNNAIYEPKIVKNYIKISNILKIQIK